MRLRRACFLVPFLLGGCAEGDNHRPIGFGTDTSTNTTPTIEVSDSVFIEQGRSILNPYSYFYQAPQVFEVPENESRFFALELSENDSADNRSGDMLIRNIDGVRFRAFTIFGEILPMTSIVLNGEQYWVVTVPPFGDGGYFFKYSEGFYVYSGYLDHPVYTSYYHRDSLIIEVNNIDSTRDLQVEGVFADDI